MHPYEIPVRPERRFSTYTSPLPSRTTFQQSLVTILTALPTRTSLQALRRNNGSSLSLTEISGELIFEQKLAHSGIIFFRLPGATLEARIEHLDRLLTEHRENLQLGKFLLVTPGQIRVAGR